MTHNLDICLVILISGSDLLNTGEWLTPWTHVQWFWLLIHQRGTHDLDTCSAVLISGFKTLRIDSQPGCVFNHFNQWFWSAQKLGKQLTFWTHVQSFSSVALIYLVLKHWRVTHILDVCSAFLSVVLICSKPEEQVWATHKLVQCVFSLSCQWFWSAQTSLKMDSHPGCVFSHSCQWFWFAQTLENNSHPGYMFSHGSDFLKHWRVTHILDTCSAILVSGSDLFKHWRATHTLGMSSHSCQWFWSTQTLEKHSPAGCMFISSFQWFWSAQIWRATHNLDHVQWSYQWFWSAQTLENNSHPRCVANLLC